MSTASLPTEVGVVVIGRNEGHRLVACLSSLEGTLLPVIYVDSGSSDGSAQAARAFCESVVELDPSRPFSAGRARNEGWAALRAAHPKTRFIQFLDGDCTLLNGWLAAAAEAMSAAPDVGIVVGELVERRPQASVYNRLCALEWKSPAGEVRNFGALGGIMFVRADAFEQVGGFNETVIAGEDSELGLRIAQAGGRIMKVAAPMATHDADMLRFSQWWRRAVRSGHAIAQRFNLHGNGPTRDSARERRSVLVWGVALPAAILLLLPATRGASALLVAGYAVLAWRIARHRLDRGDARADAWLYARYTVLGKFAEAIGMLKFHFNKMSGRYRIIEYK
jgi:GT2 family glycosyltransferase